MKIGIVAPGRFHAFELARALLERGHRVTVFTNYPQWAVERFGLGRQHTRGFWLHGAVARFRRAFRGVGLDRPTEVALHRIFGRWACSRLAREDWDVIHPWSGVAEESLWGLAARPPLKLLMRGSAHIRTQARLLREEEQRTRKSQDRPSAWMVAREEREYSAADRIVVLSSFAYDTFVAEGVDPDRLIVLPLGASLARFRPAPDVVRERCRRILSGRPIRVLFVGTLSFRKGAWDLSSVVRRLVQEGFEFTCVGPRLPEVSEIVSGLKGLTSFRPKVLEEQLVAEYAAGDVFMFPTIEDGYAQVLAQAAASGLPILVTTNCSGPDLVREGMNGWILPIRSPEAFVERLRWCAAHRRELAAMVERTYLEFQPRDWSHVAADFEALCRAARAPRHSSRAGAVSTA